MKTIRSFLFLGVLLAGCSMSSLPQPSDAEALAAVRDAQGLQVKQGLSSGSIETVHVKSCKQSKQGRTLVCALQVNGGPIQALMWPTSNASHPWRCILAPQQR